MKRIIFGVGVATAIAAGTQAYAEVITFINPAKGEPGHFAWSRSFSGGMNPEDWLDITRPSTDQTELVGPMSVGQSVSFDDTGEFFNVTYSGASVVTGDIGQFSGFTVSLASGTEIDGSFTYASESIHVWDSFFYNEVFSYFAVGSAGYMGVQFSDVDGDHYGWIGVVRHFPLDFEAFAWGYETEPGVAIIAGIPVCIADLDDDGMVGITDFLFLLSVWGTPDADIDGDGDTGITDFLLLLSQWGPCP
jgi:hypothetical protein